MLRSRMLRSAGASGGGGDMSDFYVLTDQQVYQVGSAYRPGQIYKEMAYSASFPEMGANSSTPVGDYIAFGYVISTNSSGQDKLNSYSLQKNTSSTSLTNLTGSPIAAGLSEARAGYNAGATTYDAANEIVPISQFLSNIFLETFTIFNVLNSSKSSYTTLTPHLFTSGTTASISNVSKHDVFVAVCYDRSDFSTITETSSILNASLNSTTALFKEHPDTDEDVCGALVYAESSGTLSFSTTNSFDSIDFFYLFQIS